MDIINTIAAILLRRGIQNTPQVALFDNFHQFGLSNLMLSAQYFWFNSNSVNIHSGLDSTFQSIDLGIVLFRAAATTEQTWAAVAASLHCLHSAWIKSLASCLVSLFCAEVSRGRTCSTISTAYWLRSMGTHDTTKVMARAGNRKTPQQLPVPDQQTHLSPTRQGFSVKPSTSVGGGSL